jgi:preprotein translocase subunit Sec61beta
MAQKNKGPGIQSAAGLIRYFDAEEETSFKISPGAVLVMAAVVGIGMLVVRALVTYK